MIDDEKLFEMTGEIDDFLNQFLIKHNINPLNFTGILLARLIHMNNNSSDFYRLINSVTNHKHEKRVIQ